MNGCMLHLSRTNKLRSIAVGALTLFHYQHKYEIIEFTSFSKKYYFYHSGYEILFS